MLLAHRNTLIDLIPKLIAARNDFENLLRAIARGSVLNEIAAGLGYTQAVTDIVDRAVAANWIRDLCQEMLRQFPGRPDLLEIDETLKAASVVPTTKEPFDEVLLESDRPFINRRSLRNVLLRLVDPAGDRVLLVEGQPQSGKTFSYYLLNHAATRRGYSVHKFDLSRGPGPKELAEIVLSRFLGTAPQLVEQGLESAERWAEKLADGIAAEVLRKAAQRVFVFDSFPSAALPPGTLSLIARVATYADQELQGVLRVVLVRFPGELPSEVDDVAARDEAQPFTATDMVSAMMQIATARGWNITEGALKAKIDEFEAERAQSLRERFRFLRNLVLTLGSAAKAQAAQP